MRIGLPWAAAGAAGATRDSRIPSRLIPDIVVARMLLMAMPSQVARRYALDRARKLFWGFPRKLEVDRLQCQALRAPARASAKETEDRIKAARPIRMPQRPARRRMQGLPESQVRMPTPRVMH